MRPIRYGPTKPPRLPNELINAIVAAAAVPLTNMPGIAQHVGSALQMPAAATESANTPSTASWANAVATRPMAPTPAATAACTHRSRVRSECPPTSTIDTAAARNGIVATSDTPTLSNEVSDLTICGVQKLTL